jgi:DEAD/DEAH box helicase domain-containing protein
LAGVAPERVVVIEGERFVPSINEAVDRATPATLDELESADDDAAGTYLKLCIHPVARRLRDLFDPKVSRQSYQPLSAVAEALRAMNLRCDDAESLRWLDLLTMARTDGGRNAQPFLPLRLHAFHNTLNGLWACVNPACAGKHGTPLADPDWPFGRLFLEERTRCPCGSPVYAVTSCDDCNETFLAAEMVSAGGTQRLLPAVDEAADEFSLERDPEEPDAVEPDGEAEPSLRFTNRTPALVVNGETRGVAIQLHAGTMELSREAGAGKLALRVQDVDTELILVCPCCGSSGANGMQFRRARIGAPFLLGNIAPALLEFCPDGEHPLNSPMRGRRMITFTDSRQGTARIAAQLQQDAERMALRSAVYRKLVAGGTSKGPEQATIEKRIADLRAVLKMTGSNVQIEKLIRDDEAALAVLQGGVIVAFREMADWLATQVPDIGQWIHRYYAELDQEFRHNRGKQVLAEILLCREFARRPKRQNSLETLGLASVQYSKLAAVQVLKPAAQQHGFALDEWRGFLKLCLDYVVRQSFGLKVPGRWDRWGGNKVYSKQILSPTSPDRPTRSLMKWPLVRPAGRQHRLVRILAHVLRLDPCLQEGRDRIDALLLAAWDDLVASSLLQIGGGQGRYLDIEDFGFQPMRAGWICPVTRRVLDITLRGVTPYLPERIAGEDAVQCRKIAIPLCEAVGHDFASDADRITGVRQWLETEAALKDLVLTGVWSNVSDRVVEGGGYYRAVEHSAQQAGTRLQQYEKQFREGAINLMSCSTTMEMGVDIGGINTVAMNNVPPHPANYLQRAGRAGRRGETRSVALTVCKNNPHDQHVLRNTTWPFVTRLPTPTLSLSSTALVQRHINALLLARFLRLQDRQGKLDKLTLEWWMLPRGTSRQERFVAWCECFDKTAHQTTYDGILALVRRTVFDGRQGYESLVAETGHIAAEHAGGWLAEFNAIESQIAELSKRADDDRIPLKALQVQRKRLTGEYLLRELATGGFLPGYGFPTDITTFETLNKDSAELTRMREGEGREDNRYQRRELPSRDTVTALREYAPGAAVVIDGLVYESAGITLNWHAPATLDEANELQNIRHAWRCGRCGASGTNVPATRLESCTECGAPLSYDRHRFQQYLEPAGFSVDLYAETHNDITLQRYLPVEQPWISVNADWLPLANPTLGSFRSSADGSVFHFSSGVTGHGYAVCLECGRSAPMGCQGDEAALPAVFQKPHKRLRGRRGSTDDWMCGGSESPFKIKTGLNFGREYRTDVLEIALLGIDGHPLTDVVAAFTIAVALRRAIAEHLGVDIAELGCDTKPVRDDGGRQMRVVQVFDQRSGGYASLVAPELPALVRAARRILDCEEGCESACQHCVLSFDTRFRAEGLDRKEALAFLSEEWLTQLQLPATMQFFGASSSAEHEVLTESIVREINRGEARQLHVYLQGEPSEWDLAPSPLRGLLHRLSVNSDVELNVMMGGERLDGVSDPNANTLRGLMDICSVKLMAGTPPPLARPGTCLASVANGSGEHVSWATSDARVGAADGSWGSRSSAPLVRGTSSGPRISAGTVQLPKGAGAGAAAYAITAQLDGPCAGFGRRFWELVAGRDLVAKMLRDRNVVEVVYEDRYLSTPLTLALLLEVLSELKRAAEQADRWQNPSIAIRSMHLLRPPAADGQTERGRPRDRYCNRWSSEWPLDALRDTALRQALDYSGLQGTAISLPRRDLVHGRCLTIRCDSGRDVRVWLDQGLSYWSLDRNDAHGPVGYFPMEGGLDDIVQQLGSPTCTIRGQMLPTYVFVDGAL